MPTNTTYQGHLPNGNPVQRHSAGEYYPCVLFQRGLDADTRYYILFDGVEYYMGCEQAFQVQTAEQVMQLHSPQERHRLLLDASDVAANSIQGALKAEPVQSSELVDLDLYTLQSALNYIGSSEDAREYAECLQKILKEAIAGNTVATCLVSIRYWTTIAFSLQKAGFDIKYSPRSVYVMELLVKWGDACA